MLWLLPGRVERELDLGCGDGRLLEVVLAAHPTAEGVAVDGSPAMLEAARARFAGRSGIEVVGHDLARPLPALGAFDVVVSSFAIHHLEHPRVAELYAEIAGLLRPGGVFANLEHVASPTERLHRRFFAALDADPEGEDPSNRLAPVADQLAWLRAAGLDDVDCHWKWLELALIAGVRPG